MGLRSFLLGRGEFKSPPEIVLTIEDSPKFHSSEEDLDVAEPLLIFQTSRQQTWLVATTQRLYCILDDLNRSFTRVQWSIAKERLVDITKRAVIVPIATRDKTTRTGLLNIDERPEWWLFTKDLFASESVDDQIRRLIARNMLSQK
jgi:hypothetical protein